MVMDLDNAKAANWACGSLTGTILIVRLLTCHARKPRRFDLTMALVISSLVAMLARTILNYHYLQYNSMAAYGPSSPEHVHAPDFATGTILVLCARLFITTFSWLQCAILLLFYTNVVSHITWTRYLIRVCWGLILSTYIAVVLATFLECRPFRLYWETPASGRDHCTRAYVQLVVQCASNIAIDFVLLAISSPLLKYRDRTWMQRFQLAILYAIGTFCIIVSVVRTIMIYDRNSAQAVRSVWASIQEVVAAFVANAPSVYGAVMLQRRRSNVRSRSTGSGNPGTSLGLERKVTAETMRDRTMSIFKHGDSPELREYLEDFTIDFTESEGREQRRESVERLPP